jgi:hypothetical protein
VSARIVILPKTQTVWHKNPISGHEWSTEPLKGFEVWGGHFFMTSHSTLRSAEREAVIRKSLERRLYEKNEALSGCD